MDRIRARIIAEDLAGRQVGGWTIEHLIDSGKSALVLLARQGDQLSALKVFDPELVERFGEETQLARIERECQLIDHNHPNIIKIYGGGKCPVTDMLYVVMEYLPYGSLAHRLTIVPRGAIRKLIAQLASAAHYLEDLGLAHRDIKPSNIVVSDDFEHLTLLDLGVLRPFGDASLTDDQGRQFVGTLQYSSPEFLFRNEEDSKDGWRALTFYQIGAVLHDLIMKRAIFEEFEEPYARMVEAVKYVTPSLDPAAADPDLIALASTCLVKDPSKRLELVTWASFSSSPPAPTVDSIRDRVRRRQQSSYEVRQESEMDRIANQRTLNEVLGMATRIIRTERISNSDIFPPVEIHDLPAEQDAIVFRVAFSKSPARQLHACFGVKFEIVLLDRATSIVELKASAAIADHVDKLEPDAYSEPTVLYKGPFNEELVGPQLTYYMYQALEATIQHDQLADAACHALHLKPREGG